MTTEFLLLNKDWNAEPNAPFEEVTIDNKYLSLSFYANPWADEGFDEGHIIEIQFIGCNKWRLGATNDEGWYEGQCRFSNLAPAWGEFYEVKGNLLLDECPDDWQQIDQGKGERHFLFYLRDSTFECDADTYEVNQYGHT